MSVLSADKNPLIALLRDLPPAHAGLCDYLIEHATNQGDACACVEGSRSITYRELASLVAQHAALLRALGIQRGDRVAALVPPSIDFFVCFLAAASLGAVWVGLNPRHTRSEMQYVLAHARPKVLWARSRIAGRDYIEDLRALAQAQLGIALFDSRTDAADLPSIAALLTRTGADREERVVQAARDTDAALLVYTSGTTGAPKGALVSHRALIRGALVRSHLWRVQPMRSLNNAPVSHIGGVGDIACTTLVAGGCQIFQEKFDPADTLALLARERITYWYQAPTMFQLCLDHPSASATHWSHLQAAICSGGRPSDELLRRLARVARHLAVDYSMTESVGAIALTPLLRSSAALADTVGWPDPGRGIRLVDPARSIEVPDGEPGEVQLRDAWVFNGYRNAAADVDARSSDGWFRTGDLAVRRADGSLQLTGRLKEMFKSGGYNIYPKEIEQAIERHSGVATAVVVPVEDDLYGEVGVAFIVPKDARISSAQLQAHCRSLLAGYKIPKHFILYPALPMLAIGKVDKAELRARARQLKSAGSLA